MVIDLQTAASLGFPKREYIAVERERRFLCREVPHDLVRQSETIADLYVSCTRLRLRDARPVNGGAAMLRLSRKADFDARTRLVTSIYLPEAEFQTLAVLLPGMRIRKLRHRLVSDDNAMLIVDEFQDALHGLILAEAAFETDDAMARFQAADFMGKEVTDDPRYTGAALATNGLPEN